MAKSGNNFQKQRLTDKTPGPSVLLTHNQGTRVKFSFSFQYFTQSEYFGIGDQDAHWYMSMLNRLKDMSEKDISILDNKKEREHYRLHIIDFNAPNCPIRRSEIPSVPKEILENEDEFPFWQFQLSMGTGRVIGFFDTDKEIFFVVFFDPKHNMQPSKNYHYAVNPTILATTPYEELLASMAIAEELRSKCEYVKDCPMRNLQSRFTSSGFIYVALDADLREFFEDKMDDDEFVEGFKNYMLERFVE